MKLSTELKIRGVVLMLLGVLLVLLGCLEFRLAVLETAKDWGTIEYRRGYEEGLKARRSCGDESCPLERPAAKPDEPEATDAK